MSSYNEYEPDPKKNSQPAIWDLVLEDIKERDKIGQERYGTRLQPFNGRDALVDAYQEALDLVVYLRQAIYERDKGYLAPEWERPSVYCPNRCTESAPMEVVACDTGDGWAIAVECPYCGEIINDDFGWPFIIDHASPNDFRKIGVRVE